MKPIVQDLPLALLTRVKERGGNANKTKLLKLLYPADIEHFRKHGETLTGFDLDLRCSSFCCSWRGIPKQRHSPPRRSMPCPTRRRNGSAAISRSCTNTTEISPR